MQDIDVRGIRNKYLDAAVIHGGAFLAHLRIDARRSQALAAKGVGRREKKPGGG